MPPLHWIIRSDGLNGQAHLEFDERNRSHTLIHPILKSPIFCHSLVHSILSPLFFWCTPFRVSVDRINGDYTAARCGRSICLSSHTKIERIFMWKTRTILCPQSMAETISVSQCRPVHYHHCHSKTSTSTYLYTIYDSYNHHSGNDNHYYI